MVSRLLLAVFVVARAVLIPGEAGRALSVPMTWSDIAPIPRAVADRLDLRGDPGIRTVTSA